MQKQNIHQINKSLKPVYLLIFNNTGAHFKSLKNNPASTVYHVAKAATILLSMKIS